MTEKAMKKESESKKQLYGSFLGGLGLRQEDVEKFFKRQSKTQSASLKNAPTIEELVKVIRALPPVYDSVELSKEKVESIYALGYQAYEQGRYGDAVTQFRLAYILDATDDKYLFSLGMALEKDKMYFEAASAYHFWSFFYPKSPMGHFRSGMCFLEMNDTLSAASDFSLAAELSKNKKELLPIYERAMLCLSGLEENHSKG